MSFNIIRKLSASSSNLLRLVLFSRPSSCRLGCPHSSDHDFSPFMLQACLYASASSRKGSGTEVKGSKSISSENAEESFAPQTSSSIESGNGRPSERVLQMADEIANLTLLEVLDLSRILKKKLRLPDAATAYYGGGMPQSGVVLAEPQKPQKQTFDLKLEKYEPGSKTKIANEVQAIASIGSKKAKSFMENIPAVLKAGVSKQEADEIIERLKALGATVTAE